MSLFKLHSLPFKGTNNRKQTRGRIKLNEKIQSIPIYKKDEFGQILELIGYKYIQHPILPKTKS